MRPFLKGRVALVTGAGRGLGAGTAKLLARAGAAIVATDHDAAALSDLVSTVQAEGAHAVGLPADLSADTQVAELLSQAVGAAERIDYLIHTEQSTETIGTKSWEVSAERWDSLCGANATTVLNLIRHAVPVMQAQHSGRLLFVSSSATFQPWPETGTFAATVAMVNQLVQSLALELHDTGVTTNAFNPGPIDTAVYDDIPEALKRSAPTRPDGTNPGPAGRPPELVAQLILWLCAPETTDLTGEFIQWNNPNTIEAMHQFLQSHQIGAVA